MYDQTVTNAIGSCLEKEESPMANRPAILAEGLHKHYGKTHALAGLDLVAEQGSVLALLGPNGAGKTTAVRILTTLLRPDSGRAEVAGLDVVKNADALRAHIGLADRNSTGLQSRNSEISYAGLCLTTTDKAKHHTQANA